jgi:hypothetical protein
MTTREKRDNANSKNPKPEEHNQHKHSAEVVKSDISTRRREIVARMRESFSDFLCAIDSLCYFDYMVESGRYTESEILEWNYIENFDPYLERAIDRRVWLEKIYSLLGVDDVDIDLVLEKYDGWFYTALHRIYKKYIDQNHKVHELPDSRVQHVFL